jgi:hypothetical protein
MGIRHSVDIPKLFDAGLLKIVFILSRIILIIYMQKNCMEEQVEKLNALAKN